MSLVFFLTIKNYRMLHLYDGLNFVLITLRVNVAIAMYFKDLEVELNTINYW